MQNPVLTTENQRKCFVHVGALGITKVEAVKKVLGGYFDEELRKEFPEKAMPDYVVIGILTRLMQKNSDDCGIFVLYFMKHAVEAFLEGNTQLLSDIETIYTAPRSAHVSPSMMRKDILKHRAHSHHQLRSAVSLCNACITQ
ncbi:hypothetical protein L914_06930 [Phytophthora nicotianae]|uniref:Ubiquitin-like protease family profile domain-containing protein n=1 Tax=Phytophthora nicotianae TaxID=4792 RepID=W2NIW7_PHYNI|nr:hypothetical protein L914_06930 [Phytophthora nicotianae]